ncbi:hypothetical protein ACJIZ3_016586 [Penstemon smallii]|uniref:Uncharacterized protein n=1 Tax=Penstemon smallii TaxID=265156 RepID=A0ABD3ST49_9LAMI
MKFQTRISPCSSPYPRFYSCAIDPSKITISWSFFRKMKNARKMQSRTASFRWTRFLSFHSPDSRSTSWEAPLIS